MKGCETNDFFEVSDLLGILFKHNHCNYTGQKQGIGIPRREYVNLPLGSTGWKTITTVVLAIGLMLLGRYFSSMSEQMASNTSMNLTNIYS